MPLVKLIPVVGDRTKCQSFGYGEIVAIKGRRLVNPTSLDCEVRYFQHGSPLVKLQTYPGDFRIIRDVRK